MVKQESKIVNLVIKVKQQKQILIIKPQNQWDNLLLVQCTIVIIFFVQMKKLKAKSIFAIIVINIFVIIAFNFANNNTNVKLFRNFHKLFVNSAINVEYYKSYKNQNHNQRAHNVKT
ncbi:unnamed protein product [Paramecium pentaurelia]|uniref:Transmembrane protein n=1 Tax=Paramecium pentaurelia TaxID=43138 RepID=A0A8S1WQP4_9CILI|nr:unnamed protein product [Paramecium pentaurelia]